MRIKLPPDVVRGRIRPATPTVVLTDEAYDALLEMSDNSNVSMRQLASAIIIQAAEDGIEIAEGALKNENTANRP